MFLKMLKGITILASLSFNQNVFATSINIDELKDKTNEYYTYPQIVKNDGVYFVKIYSTTYFDRNGNMLTRNQATSLGDMYYNLNKVVKIPVNLVIEKHERFGGKYQFLGFGDDDARTGKFENYTNLKVEDLFSRYSGKSYNAGIVLIGGGYSKAISDKNIELSEGNGSIFLPGPAGMPIGINAGFEKLNFTFTIKAPLKAAFSEYNLTGIVDGKVIDREYRSESISLDSVFKADLRNE